MRRELTKVIKTQGQRIRELEEILCRQNNLRNCLQRKLDELYCEFGRLDEDEGDRTRLTCPGNQRGGPDCAGVLHPAPTPPSPEPMLQLPPKRRLSYRRSVLRKVNREVDLVETEAERTELDEDGDRVHWLAEKRTQSEKFTRRPVWINEPREEVMESESRMAIRFGKNSTYVVPDKSNHSNLSYSVSDSSHSLHNRART